ncbi:TIGR04282 family arsenosugar biosynthesis glycosyltransferase [Derxia lacustris]|uniref:TIGR04282 family arsenosugar biosynthesis glycosyltransferase n=1 Tax=Derxia lacustris TaxID=764842 RepID=UPI000A16F9A7|nr:TIGR04282 family arsenosugar biosynthesis glycosyltransferase [Derxia lacustris]
MKPARILLFAKAPLPGLAKTRLIPALGADGAAMLARRLLDHALREAVEADIGPVELCATPPDDAVWAGIALPPGVTRSDQGAGDLGQRLARAAARSVAAGETPILIGADCPALDARRLMLVAASCLDADATMVPARDGGYVALGLARFHPSLFDGIAWSTDGVAAATRARVAALGWRLRCLPALTDIDEPADLAALPPHWPEAQRAELAP